MAHLPPDTLDHEARWRLALEECERLLAMERRACSEAVGANHAKDELLAAFSHELRSPLQAILGWSRILRQGASDRAEVEHALEIIDRNATLQAQLLENLMDMNQILSNTLNLELESGVELMSLIGAAIQSVQRTAEAKGVIIRCTIPAGAISVRGDARRLQQVWGNLLSNAVQFTSPDGEVEITVESRPAEIEVCVRDTGCGIDPELLPLVFERFRAPTATAAKHSGLGVELAITRRLVELHGGSIRATSPGVGRGSTFIVVIPSESAIRDVSPAIGAPSIGPVLDRMERPAAVSRLQKERILVLDDEVELRELIARFLAREGYAVRCAESIQDAIRMAAEFHPTLILVDWLLDDGHDGADALRAVREVLPDVKAVVMSGLPPEQVRSRLDDLQVLEVLEKPFQVEALFEQIQRALT